MKTVLAIFALIVGLMIYQNSWGNEPAYARECRIAGGIYWSISVNDTFDTPLCRFNDAVIGAEVLALYKWNRQVPQALNTYFNTSSTSTVDQVCGTVGAKLVVGGDSNRDFWRICVFPDNSIIGAEALARTYQSPFNGGLNTALGM